MRLNEESKEAMSSLEDRKGRLTPTEVLDEARDPSSPLHPHFEWEDSIAAESYRLIQARELILQYTIHYQVEDKGSFVIKQYVRDVDKPQLLQGYINVAKTKKVPETLSFQIRQVIGMLDRAENFATFREEDLPEGTLTRIVSIRRDLNDLIQSLS